MTSKKPLWTCPRCGARYVTRNQWHSCVRLTEADFLAGKSPRAVALYDSFKALVGKIGPFDIHVAKSRAAFMVRVRFAGVSSLSERGMTCGFWLKRLIESPRFRRVEQVSPRDWIYTLRIESPEDLDTEVEEWMREAYEVGKQSRQWQNKPG